MVVLDFDGAFLGIDFMVNLKFLKLKLAFENSASTQCLEPSDLRTRYPEDFCGMSCSRVFN